jgi:hypothetical protein
MYMRALRLLVLGYGLLVCLASIWAWWVDVTMLHGEREHLLPDFILFFVGAPLSLLLNKVTPFGPSLVGLVLLTICAAVQFAFLWWLVRKTRSGNGRA